MGCISCELTATIAFLSAFSDQKIIEMTGLSLMQIKGLRGMRASAPAVRGARSPLQRQNG